MHLRGQHAEDRPRPREAPHRVGDHLALVDHGHVVAPCQLELFGGRGDMGVAVLAVLLLAGRQRARDAVAEQQLLRLEGEKPQRGQIHARRRPAQALKSGVGLARIRAAGVDDEMPLHRPRLRVLVLRPQLGEKPQRPPDRPGHVDDRPDIPQRLVEKRRERKIVHCEHRVDVRVPVLRREGHEHPLRDRAEDAAVPRPQAHDRRGVRIPPRPEQRRRKTAQHRLRRDFLPVQRQKRPQPRQRRRRLGLRRTGQPPKPLQDRLVIAPRQQPRRSLGRLRIGPRVREQRRGVLRRLFGRDRLRLPPRLRDAAPLPERLRLLRRRHVRPPPDHDRPFAALSRRRRRQQRVDERARPPAPRKLPPRQRPSAIVAVLTHALPRVQSS